MFFFRKRGPDAIETVFGSVGEVKLAALKRKG
jgi:hypothetical protein